MRREQPREGALVKVVVKDKNMKKNKMLIKSAVSDLLLGTSLTLHFFLFVGNSDLGDSLHPLQLSPLLQKNE